MKFPFLKKKIFPGENETLILLVFRLFEKPVTLTSVCDFFHSSKSKTMNEATVYLCLKRLTDKGFLARKPLQVLSADGILRTIGEYSKTQKAEIYLESLPI